MKKRAWLAALAVSIAGAGCSRLQEAAMSLPDKVNAAHPPAPEVDLAEKRVLTLLAADAKALATLKSHIGSRLAVRAIDCSKSATIGRLDSIADVKRLGLDTSCFQKHDSELRKYYAVRTIGTLLAMPPLRPLQLAGPMAAIPPGRLSSITTAAVARDAAVAAVFDGSGQGAVVELPGGKPIAVVSEGGNGDAAMSLSPNGRVLTTRAWGQGTTFFDAETGHTIWSLGERGGRFMAWLPDVQSFVVSGSDGDAMLADGATGSFERHPLSTRNGSYGMSLPGDTSRLLMGTSSELVLVEHVRSGSGLGANAVKSYSLRGQSFPSSGAISMQSGRRVVFASARDVGWIDLESGTSGVWRTSPRFANRLAKLDENRFLFESQGLNGLELSPWVFDIVDQTVAPAEAGGDRGVLVPIGDRAGFLRRGSQAWFGDQVATGAAQPLDKAVAAYELEVQLARLQRARERDAAQAVHPALAAAPERAEAPATALPGLDGVPADAEVHIVGVYEAQGSTDPRYRGAAGVKQPRDVHVTVRPTARPVVLVLASYEPVNWVVIERGGPRVAALLLSGYHPSRVTGGGNAPLLRIGSSYAYAAASPEYAKLRQAVMLYTGTREIRSFQGSYAGAEFAVGGGAPAVPPNRGYGDAGTHRATASAVTGVAPSVDPSSPAASVAPGVVPSASECTALASDATRYRECLRRVRRAEVQRVASRRLASISVAIADHIDRATRTQSVVAVRKDGRDAAWCESLVRDAIARRNMSVVDDEDAAAPRWAPNQAPYPILDQAFLDAVSPGTTVPHGYVTLRWRGSDPLVLRVAAPCINTGDSRPVCDAKQITSIYVYDDKTPIACNIAVVDRAYWPTWAQKMTPILAGGASTTR